MRTTIFLLLLFFSPFISFSQTILLHQPTKSICRGLENEFNFSLNGDFPSDDTFILYFVFPSGEKVVMDSSKTSPVKFTTDIPYYNYMIESRKTKIQSNIINVKMVYTYIDIDYTTTKACTGRSVKLDLWPNSIKYDKIEWLKDGKPIEGANGYSYQASESGNYYVRVIQDGCMSLDSLDGHVNVKIGELTKPEIGPDSYLPICDDYGNTFSILGNVPDLSYQWQLNGVDINGANGSRYLAKQSGDFSIKIRQGICEAVSEKFRIKVGELTVSEIYITPDNEVRDNVVEVCEGQEVTFRGISYLVYSSEGVSFLEGVRYQWQKDGIDIAGANNYIYKTKETGKYRLKITQGHCAAFSKTMIISSASKTKTIKFNGFRQELCIGEEMSGYIALNDNTGGNNLSFKIYKDNQIFKEARPYDYFIIKESGKYHAVVNFSLPDSPKTCTLLSDTIQITFKDKVINYSINRPAFSSTCLDSLLVNGWEYGANYNPKHQWKLNGAAIANANMGYIMAREKGLYQLETQVNKGCTYLSNPVKLEFNKLDVKLSKYFPACYDSLYLHPNISSIVEYFDYNWRLIRKPLGHEWQLNGKVIGYVYNQPFLSEGTYKYTLKQGACVASDSIKIVASDLKVNIPRTLITTGDSLFICPNGAVSITAPTGDFIYTWLKDNQPVASGNKQTLKAQTGTYSVLLEKGECTRVSNAVVVKENKTPVTATVSGNKELMSGDSAKIKIDLTSLPPWTIKLTNNQEFTTNKTPFEFAVKPLQTTIYELASVKNDCGVGTVSGKAEVKIIILGNEELADAKIKLFPVPTQGICQLSVETVLPEKLGFQLYTVTGKMLMKSEESKPGHSFNEIINLESVPDGVYVLKIKIGGRVVNRKIIKGN